MLDRRRFVALSSALTLAPILGPHVARAQAAWPSRFVRSSSPSHPAAATDIIARIIGNRLSESGASRWWSRTSGGGGANIGTAAVAQSDPDGYTMLLQLGARRRSTASSIRRSPTIRSPTSRRCR